MSNDDIKLSAKQSSVYGLLRVSPNTDVPTYLLYEAAFDVEVHKHQQGVLILGMDNRTMQQRIGPIIARINEKLADGWTVEPGRLKQTYRLNTYAG